MDDNQKAAETPEAVEARLAAINTAVDDTLANMPKFHSLEEETKWLEQNTTVNPGCPIDPQERLMCEGCQ